MFNYAQLSDLDFEKLGADMMGRMFNTPLRYFPSGQDGGIDLVDDLNKKNIMIQVKHYEKSSYSTFKRSLKDEILKVEKQQPKQYYIFTSQSLTPKNITEIYLMFQGYMSSEKNIITREDIDRFLKQNENIDILRSHFKLWVTSDTILADFLNQNTFFDSEVLLSDIEEELKYFVQTEMFDQCMGILESERKILLYGDPGVGKTLNSKMLLLRFAKEGYRIRYSSDNDISELKKSLASDPNSKEVIFLDDCLGQHYFNMKEGHDHELLYLIKLVSHYQNKILILNSRVTILNEARSTYEELDRYFSREKISIQKINMNEMSIVDKAKVFYSLLKRNNVSNTYYNDVRRAKGYLKVIQHENFNPRVMEYVTLPTKLKEIDANNYFEFIMENLKNPSGIWKNEFEKRMRRIDRLFMYTLYSLTDRHVAIEVLEEAFDYVIETDTNIDPSLYNFGSILERLNQSVVKIIDVYGRNKIGVLNPSVNDYIRMSLFENRLLLKGLRENAIYLNQLERLYNRLEFEKLLEELLVNKELFEYRTIRKGDVFDIRLALIGKNTVLDEEYIEDMNLLPDLHEYIRIGNYQIGKVSTLKYFLQKEELRNFYKTKKILIDSDNIEQIFDGLDFMEALILIDSYHENLEAITREDSNYMMEYVLDEFEHYIEEDFDYRDIVGGYLEPDVTEELLESDYDFMIKEVRKRIEELVVDVKNSVILENVMKHFEVYKDEIRDYLQDNLNDLMADGKKVQNKVNLVDDSVNVEDILNRRI